MAVVTVRELGQHLGQEVELRGWLYNRRSSGKLHFLIVRDGTGFVQAVVARQEVDAASFAAAGEATQESSLRLRGVVKEDPRSPQGHELAVTGLELVHLAEPYPITHKEHGVDFLMDHRHLWLRTPRQVAIMRVRAQVLAACREWLDGAGFIQVDTPILTPAACEGTSTLFETDYFGERAYLAQSGQLYNEAAAMALGRVYCLSPAFRAEKSKTRRHLIEFWMVEPEMAFCDQAENEAIQEALICHIVRRVLERCQPELAAVGRDVQRLEAVKPPFPRISYDDALGFLKARGLELPWGQDFGSPHETAIAEAHDRPIFVTGFPSAVKAFYTESDPQRPEVAVCADLLAPEGYGEIIGGGQRLADLARLEERIDQHGLPRSAFEWYLDLRRYGSVPHSGFGLGIERTVAWILRLEHIREAAPFPRMLQHIYP